MTVLKIILNPKILGFKTVAFIGIYLDKAIRNPEAVKQLKNIPELSDYTILPYSGAQLISPDETINLNPDQFDSSQLRRIEIRVRRKNSNN